MILARLHIVWGQSSNDGWYLWSSSVTLPAGPPGTWAVGALAMGWVGFQAADTPRRASPVTSR